MKRLHPIRALTPKPKRKPPARLRRGSVLIIVLVLILMLTYGVYGFTERMLAEAEAADAHGRATQAIAFAESGVEFAASVVTTRAADPENPVSLYHRPDLFAGVILRQSPTPSSVGRFSLVAPVEGDVTYRQIRFGLADESGKLNLNAIASLELEELDQHYLLMYLPGMTDDVADAILDYIDEDDEIRPLGAESEFYKSLSPPYFAKNGPLESIEELLLVRGVTPQLLYGEDANRNGLLDGGENDGPAAPIDDGDGVLLTGWLSFLTIHSRESNLRPDGSKKIHINQGLLTDLYDAIVEELDDEDAARFIVAYRMYGPNDGEAEETESGDADGQTDGTSGGNPSSGQSGGDGRPSQSTGGGSQPTQAEADEMDELAGNLAGLIGGAQEGGEVTRGGLDLSKGAKYEIASLYDLIDREVDVPEDEEADTDAETIPSLWSSSGIVTDFPFLLDNFALTENSSLEGRINVNEARVEVLYGLPEMTPSLAEAIVAARVGASGQPLAEEADRRTTAWLVARGIADLPTMRKLDKYLTGRGDVFKVQAIGFFDGGGPAARVEAVIDGTVTPATVVSFRDLSDLGRGYAPSQLLPTGG